MCADYKGHVRLLCSEGCSIAYHPTCWRKFKGECVIGADKDYLATPCPTPDCEGRIKAVYIHNDKGIAKIKVCKHMVHHQDMGPLRML